jgi:hypothetical protein
MAGHSTLPEPKEPLTTSLVEALHFRYFHKDFFNHTDKKGNKIFLIYKEIKRDRVVVYDYRPTENLAHFLIY